VAHSLHLAGLRAICLDRGSLHADAPHI
jgi:hypothetical protein